MTYTDKCPVKKRHGKVEYQISQGKAQERLWQICKRNVKKNPRWIMPYGDGNVQILIQGSLTAKESLITVRLITVRLNTAYFVENLNLKIIKK